MLSPSPTMDGAGSALTTLAPDPADLMTALGALVASQNLAELALAAAQLPDKLLGAEQVVVLLDAPEGLVVGGQPGVAGVGLQKWAQELLQQGVPEGPTRAGPKHGVGIDAREAGVRGVLAIHSSSVCDDDVGRRLSELAALVSACIDQVVGRARSTQALKEARTSLAKGLHDLRTPLNSLRLGMHLLEPALKGQDPAIVQRTHRAVDRMATLVTEMFDALHKN
jgi:signal transduction histidine kinase